MVQFVIQLNNTSIWCFFFCIIRNSKCDQCASQETQLMAQPKCTGKITYRPKKKNHNSFAYQTHTHTHTQSSTNRFVSNELKKKDPPNTQTHTYSRVSTHTCNAYTNNRIYIYKPTRLLQPYMHIRRGEASHVPWHVEYVYYIAHTILVCEQWGSRRIARARGLTSSPWLMQSGVASSTRDGCVFFLVRRIYSFSTLLWSRRSSPGQGECAHRVCCVHLEFMVRQLRAHPRRFIYIMLRVWKKTIK